MLERYLNIICFDVPYPADYGGAIEEFYKIRALSQLGVKIHLHCFVYGSRKPQDALNRYCEKIYYYKRERSVKSVFSNIPFIVKTRMDDELLTNLLSNDYPVLFDATHTTGFLTHPQLKDRKKMVRLHNIEWIYYRILFDAAITPKEKLFYFLEYKKLRKYDAVLESADGLSCLSQTDVEYYREKFPERKVSLEYVFHENESVKCLEGKGKYILYHGNLSLLDNYQLITELLSNELKDCQHPIVIAGKDPHESLQQIVQKRTNVRLISNPTAVEIQTLLQEAHICLAIARNPSGVKLKLINSLFATRFVISNEAALTGSGLDELCLQSGEERTYEMLIDHLMLQSFDTVQIQRRKEVLEEKYNNLRNAQQLINHIFEKIQS